jgi:hypothetical protein
VTRKDRAFWQQDGVWEDLREMSAGFERQQCDYSTGVQLLKETPLFKATSTSHTPSSIREREREREREKES